MTPLQKLLQSQQERFDKKWTDVMQWSDDYGDRETNGGSALQIKSFLLQSQRELLREVGKECIKVMPEQTPFFAKICQNRNGLEYCGTCEQAWEYCSCSARNTGFNRGLERYRQALASLFDLADELEKGGEE